MRLADAPEHVRFLGGSRRALKRSLARSKSLESSVFTCARNWPGVGVSLRPWPADPEGLLKSLEELSLSYAMIRLHPWEEDHSEELALARSLGELGIEVGFALPQTRELVRDPNRWQAAVTRLAKAFGEQAAFFQLGQAMNRSKWGVWRPSEFDELLARALPILRGASPRPCWWGQL